MDDNSQRDDVDTSIGKIEITPIIEEMQRSYLDYAMSVIVARALPDVRDGLKPVQRRIIYAMHQMGYHHSSRYQKCASVTGETMKNYHPHGNIPNFHGRAIRRIVTRRVIVELHRSGRVVIFRLCERQS